MTEPTDNELYALLAEHWPAFATSGARPLQGMRAAMRDAIAKWGTSAPVAGEPIGHLYCGGSYGDELADWEIVADQHQCDKLNEHHGSLGKEAKLPLYTTPQSTQAQAGAVPLTHMDTKRLAWMADGWTPGHEALYVQHVLSTGGTGSLDDLRTFIDQRIALEAAHGIKGGQHG